MDLSAKPQPEGLAVKIQIFPFVFVFDGRHGPGCSIVVIEKGQIPLKGAVVTGTVVAEFHAVTF